MTGEILSRDLRKSTKIKQIVVIFVITSISLSSTMEISVMYRIISDNRGPGFLSLVRDFKRPGNKTSHTHKVANLDYSSST